MSNHKEAFCLMWYACKCGHRERIWNSRDGVTPFGCLCPSCSGTMNHVEWNSDVSAPSHKLTIGQGFWRDGTPDEAEAVMRRRLEKAQGTQWEANDQLAAELIASARDGSSGEFRPGWPTLGRYDSPTPIPTPEQTK